MGTMKELLSAGIIPTYLLHSTIPFRTVLCMPILRLGGGMLVHFTEEAGMLFALSAVMGTVNVSSAPGSLEYNILKDSINWDQLYPYMLHTSQVAHHKYK
jgi:hypothetical protein